MQTDSRPQGTAAGYAAETPTKAPEWHHLVVWDCLFNGMTTGLFLLAALADLARPAVFAPVAKVAYPVALGLLFVDLLLLTLDLGDPLRFHHMLRVFKPSSPMSLGVWSLTAYSLPLTVAAAVSLIADGGVVLEWVRKIAVVLGLLPALASAVYKGVLFSTSSQPGWKNARWMGGYFTSSALVIGGAELLALSVFLGQTEATALLQAALRLLLVLGAVPLVLLFAEFATVLAQTSPRGQLRILGLLSLVGGTVLPFCLLLGGGGAVLLLTASLLILLAALVMRHIIVMLPHAV